MSATLPKHYQKQQEFLKTPIGKRIGEKFIPKPFHKVYQPVYQICLYGSYICNTFSVLTASTFVFSFIYSTLYSVPLAMLWSGIISTCLLLGIEGLLRFFAPLFFRQYLIKRKAVKLWGIGIVIFLLCATSTSFSYFGGFDLVNTVMNKPEWEEPKLDDVTKVEIQYNKLIKDAANDAEEFKKSKLYYGRLSDKNASTYKKLLDEKAELREDMITAINSTKMENKNKIKTAEKAHKLAMENYKNDTKSKSGSLGHFSVILQILFLIAIWFIEYYDFKVAQYYKLISVSPKTENRLTTIISPTKMKTITGGNNQKNNVTRSKNKNKKQPQTSVKQGSKVKTKTVYKAPILMVSHKGKQYNLREVNNFVRIYENRFNEAVGANKNKLAISRKQRLDYWKTKQKELLAKLG